MLLQAIDLVVKAAYEFYYRVASSYPDWSGAAQIALVYVVLLALYVLAIWKAPWIAGKVIGSNNDTAPLAVSPRTIVASGLILFGFYGLIRQFLVSLSFLFDFATGQAISYDWSTGLSSHPIWPAVFGLLRLAVYTVLVLEAGRIADVTTRRLTSRSLPERGNEEQQP